MAGDVIPSPLPCQNCGRLHMEGEMDEVFPQFSQELRNVLDSAKKKSTGKRVRMVLE